MKENPLQKMKDLANEIPVFTPYLSQRGVPCALAHIQNGRRVSACWFGRSRFYRLFFGNCKIDLQTIPEIKEWLKKVEEGVYCI